MRTNNISTNIKGNGKFLEDVILKTCSLVSYSEQEVPNRLKRGQFFYNTTRKAIGIYDGSQVRYTNDEVTIVDTEGLSLATEDEAGIIKLSEEFYLNEDGQLMLNIDALNIQFDDVYAGRLITSYVDVGGISTNDEFTADQTLLDFVTALLNARVAPTYTSPTLTLSWSGEDSYEIGEYATGTITATFTQNDAGGVESNIITLDGNQVNDSNSLTAEVEFQVGESNEFVDTLTYAEGATLTDNYGYSYSTGKIEAGTLTASLTITGSRKSFGTCNPDEITSLTSDIIRSFDVSFLDVDTGSTCAVPIDQGSKFVAFAHPADLGVCNQCIQKNSGVNVILSFDRTTVQVYGANETSAEDYFLYTYTALKPLRQDVFYFKF